MYMQIFSMWLWAVQVIGNFQARIDLTIIMLVQERAITPFPLRFRKKPSQNRDWPRSYRINYLVWKIHGKIVLQKSLCYILKEPKGSSLEKVFV